MVSNNLTEYIWSILDKIYQIVHIFVDYEFNQGFKEP